MVRLSIIGLGAIGDRLLPIFKDYPDIKIASVYDIDSDRTKEICLKYDVHSAESIDDILSDESVDAVYLAVPPKYHKDIAIDIMKHDKHILCEKPLAGTIEEAKAMMDYAKGKPLVASMNFPLYYGPGYAKLKNILENDEIGEIKRIELKGIFPDWPRKWQINSWIDSKDQGGFVREVFTHFIQLVQDYFGLIELKHAHVSYPKEEGKSEIDVYAYGDVNKIPMVFSGMTGIGHQEDLKLIIWGTKGVVELVNWRDVYIITKTEKRQVDLEPYNATYHLIDAFRKAIEGKEAQIVNFEAGYHAVKIVETLLK